MGLIVCRTEIRFSSIFAPAASVRVEIHCILKLSDGLWGVKLRWLQCYAGKICESFYMSAQDTNEELPLNGRPASLFIFNIGKHSVFSWKCWKLQSQIYTCSAIWAWLWLSTTRWDRKQQTNKQRSTIRKQTTFSPSWRETPKERCFYSKSLLLDIRLMLHKLNITKSNLFPEIRFF